MESLGVLGQLSLFLCMVYGNTSHTHSLPVPELHSHWKRKIVATLQLHMGSFNECRRWFGFSDVTGLAVTEELLPLCRDVAADTIALCKALGIVLVASDDLR